MDDSHTVHYFEEVFRDVVMKSAEMLANFHGISFLDKEILERGKSYLKGADWFFGENWSHNVSQEIRDARTVFTDIHEDDTREFSGTRPYTYNQMRASCLKIDWEQHVKDL